MLELFILHFKKDWRDGLSKKEIEKNYIKKLTELNDLILKSKKNLEFLNQTGKR